MIQVWDSHLANLDHYVLYWVHCSFRLSLETAESCESVHHDSVHLLSGGVIRINEPEELERTRKLGRVVRQESHLSSLAQ